MTSILKVTEIQDPTNGNTALTIDSTGRIFMPSRPVFKATNGSSYTRDFSSGETLVDFDTVKIDVGNNYDNATGQSRFTAPVDGIYFFTTSVRLDGIASSVAYAYIRFYKNGAVQNGAALDITSGFGSTYHAFTMTDIFELTANDYVDIRCYIPGDSSVNVFDEQSIFAGYLLA